MDSLVGLFLASLVLYAASRALLLLRLVGGPNIQGISLTTQEIFAVVYCCRFSELLALYVSFGDTVLKIIKITVALASVVLIRFGSFSSTYEEEFDGLSRWALLVPPLALAAVFNKVTMVVEIFHQYSWYLEPLALIPQLTLMYRKQNYDSWVLWLTILTASESFTQVLPLLMSYQVSLKEDPYRLYAALAFCLITCVGFLLLIFQKLTDKKAVLLNESANKPEFSEVWEAEKFAFADGEDQVRGGGGGGSVSMTIPSSTKPTGL